MTRHIFALKKRDEDAAAILISAEAETREDALSILEAALGRDVASKLEWFATEYPAALSRRQLNPKP